MYFFERMDSLILVVGVAYSFVRPCHVNRGSWIVRGQRYDFYTSYEASQTAIAASFRYGSDVAQELRLSVPDKVLEKLCGTARLRVWSYGARGKFPTKTPKSAWIRQISGWQALV